MSREFKIASDNLTITGASTLIFLNPKAAPNFNIEFMRFWIGFSGNTTSNQQRVTLTTQVTAFPTLTSFTPISLKLGDPNASIITGATNGAAGTCGVNASAEGAGSKTTIHADAFNVLNGWLFVPTPPETIILPTGYTQGLNLFLPASPAAGTAGWSPGLTYREV